jgi:hypothetical protein
MQSIAFASQFARDIGVNKIVLRGGTYRIEAPIKPYANQQFLAYPGEQPIISGGILITNWQVHSGDIVKAPRMHGYRQLYVNGVKAPLNRSTVNKTLHWWDVEGISIEETLRTTGRVLAISKADYEVAGSPGTGAILVVQADWADYYLPISSVSIVGSKALVAFTPEATAACFDSPYPYNHSPYSYHIENIASPLAAGSWNYDGQWVYYRLKSGELLSSIDAVAPLADTLVKVTANNVTFDGVEFSHSNWFWQKGKVNFQGDAQIYLDESDPSIPAAIEVSYAQNFQVTRCRLTQMGGNGVRLGAGSVNAVVRGNVFKGIAGGPVVLHSLRRKAPQAGTQPGSIPIYLTDYLPNPPVADECKGHVISNNLLQDFATEYYGSCGIFGAYFKDCTISNNWLDDPPYTGISFSWGWSNVQNGCSNITIQGNRINRPVWRMSDGAGIYSVGYAAGSIISQNFFNEIAGNSFSFRDVAFPIYLDSGSDGITVNDNKYANMSPINGVSGVSGGVHDLIAPILNKGGAANFVTEPVEGVATTEGLQPHWSTLRR